MMTINRRLLLSTAILLPLSLAACSSTPVPTSFAPLSYSYLPPITLKVASIRVRDQYVPGPGAATMIAQAPEAPATALTASLDQIGGALTVAMTVELLIRTSTGQQVGYAEASVSRSQPAPSVGASQARIRAALYQMTKDMMNDMNVQFQYQVQRSLPDWLAYGAAMPSATPPSNPGMSGIAAQPLNAPPLPPAPNQ
ncbi:MAG: hypothetical protein B7X48_12435 [Acidiphilium sp. 34-60-192]|nr:MAG: hypothetical protein B7X48_12435 [Acidiphilium sp. 34-60-192]